MRGVQSLLYHGDETARRGSRLDHRRTIICFFADLAIRQEDFGSILLKYSAVVFDRSARNRGRGERLFWPPAFELPLRGVGARHGRHVKDAAYRSGPVAPAPGAYSRTRASILRKFSGTREAATRLDRQSGRHFSTATRRSYDEVLAAIKRIEAETFRRSHPNA